ncbi:J domain-containing protein [Novosphingopyxis iocasae]|uniref:J domain-containing protein n=1 Tax=Novosphingopyxis iocasae TaxID=2762729 RepID=UPI0016519CBE|nr:J domain-containing protein [Novosphingopyxis iocasae]
MSSQSDRRRHDRFHGRVGDGQRTCDHPACAEAGEFRAPPPGGHSGDGPGQWRWLCLDHVREFNAGYDFFDGMGADEIYEAQSPLGGFYQSTNRWGAGASPPPRWQDFDDPLDAIGARFRRTMPRARPDGTPLSDADAKALKTLGLERDADRRTIRRRYSELVRRYHPDRNGGDRSHEDKLQRAIKAYERLKKSPAFG